MPIFTAMNIISQLPAIKTFVFDVDGVFTDGSILLESSGSMSRSMSVLDGYAIQEALKYGFDIIIITGGDDPAVRKRFEYLGVQHYFSKIQNKIDCFLELCQRHSFRPENSFAVGDDLPDLAVMQHCAISAAPPNAVPEVLASAGIILQTPGGKGAVRECVEMVLRAQKKWGISTLSSISK